jgi:hypothetical protein
MKYYYENLDGLAGALPSDSYFAPANILRSPTASADSFAKFFEASPTKSVFSGADPTPSGGGGGVDTQANAMAIGQTAATIAPLVKGLFKGKKKKPKAPKFNPAMYQQPRSNTTKYLMYGILAVALAGAGILAYRKFKKRKA